MFLFDYYPFWLIIFLCFLSSLRLHFLYSIYEPTRQNPIAFGHVLYKRSILQFSRFFNKRPYKILNLSSLKQCTASFYLSSYFPNSCIRPSCPIFGSSGITDRILFPNQFILHILERYLTPFFRLLQEQSLPCHIITLAPRSFTRSLGFASQQPLPPLSQISLIPPLSYWPSFKFSYPAVHS